jgi:hypothetical protein
MVCALLIDGTMLTLSTLHVNTLQLLPCAAWHASTPPRSCYLSSSMPNITSARQMGACAVVVHCCCQHMVEDAATAACG